MPSSHPDREAFWRDTLTHWKRSGLSITQFCRQRRLNLSNFHRWKTKLGTTPEVATFVPVTIVADTRVELTLPNGIVAKLPLDCEPTQLAAFLKAVTSC
jgi:transposase